MGLCRKLLLGNWRPDYSSFGKSNNSSVTCEIVLISALAGF